MNFKSCLVLSLAVLVLAVCVSADRAHVERVKGAPKNPGRVQSGSKGSFHPQGFSILMNAIKTPGSREPTCEDCKALCAQYYCEYDPSCTAGCPWLCCTYGDSTYGKCPPNEDGTCPGPVPPM